MTRSAAVGDTPLGLLAIGLCASLMASILLLAPAIAGQLIVKLGFTEPQAGYTISAELAGISFASFPAFYWLSRFNWHHICYASLIAVAFGNVASSYVNDFTPLITLRFLTAIGAGNVMLITMLAAANAHNAERSYSIWLVGQLVLGALGLALLPAFFVNYDLGAFYLLLAFLSLALCAVVRFLPKQLSAPAENQSGQPKQIFTFFALLGLTGLFLYYIAIGGTWTFVEQIGVAINSDRQSIGFILSIATVAGIVGAISAPLLKPFIKRSLGVLIGCGLLAGSIALLAANWGWIEYSVASIAFKFAWTFTIPFILAALADLDHNGKIIAITNILIGLGLAVGPFVASLFLTEEANYTPMLGAMFIAAIISLVFLVIIAIPKAESKQ